MRFLLRAMPRALTASVAVTVATTAAATALPVLVAAGASSAGTSQTVVRTQSVPRPPAPAAEQAARRGYTSIRFLDFDHTRGWGQYAYIRGQVVGSKGDQRGALKRVHVRIYRKLDSQAKFHYLASRWTGTRPYPRFQLRTRALGNAVYKAVFAGNPNFQRSAGITRVLVHRSMTARLEDGSGSFHGFVKPKWNNRVVYLEKRSCATCSYQRVRAARSGDYGYFRFVVPAPRTGRWWWRASTPASGRFIWSYSAVFTTQLS